MLVVPAPQPGRDAELVKEALQVLKPPVTAREVVRAHLHLDISLLREYAEAERLPRPPPGELKQQLAESRTALLEARRTLVRWPRPSWAEVHERRQLLELLNREVERVKAHLGGVVIRPTGGKRTDQIKYFAAGCAAPYFRSAELKVTATGRWHRLSMLFYEGATGNADQDLMHVLRRMNRGGIRSGQPVRMPPSWLRERIIGTRW
jgi:hypothetical protein